jgi:hypothetical protein
LRSRLAGAGYRLFCGEAAFGVRQLAAAFWAAKAVASYRTPKRSAVAARDARKFFHTCLERPSESFLEQYGTTII